MRPPTGFAVPALSAADPTVGLRLIATGLVCLFVFTLPWEDQWVIGSFGTFSRLAGACAMGAGVLVALARGEIRAIRPIHLLLVLFVLWGALTRLWTQYPDTTSDAIRTYSQLLAMVWLIHEYAPGWAEQRRIMKCYVLGTLVSASSTIANYASGAEGEFYNRHVADGFNPNDLCVIFALSIPMSFYFSLTERPGLTTWIWKLHPIPVLLAAVLTASRGGIVAICVSLLVIPALLRWLTLLQKAVLVAILLAGLVTVAMIVPEAAFERIATLPSDAGARSMGDRAPIWEAGWEIYRAHPFAGTGLGTFPDAVQPVLGYAVVAHQVFLTVLAETGSVGFVLYAAVLITLVAATRSFPEADRRMWAILLLTWLAGSLSLSWGHRKPTWFLFAMIAARAATMQAHWKRGVRHD